MFENDFAVRCQDHEGWQEVNLVHVACTLTFLIGVLLDRDELPQFLDHRLIFISRAIQFFATASPIGVEIEKYESL